MESTEDVNPQRQSRLCTLDDFLLACIFAQAGYTRAYFTICKRLGPVVESVAHLAPTLRSTNQLLSLCHYLEREPSRVADVQYISLDAHCEFPVWAPPGTAVNSPRGRRLQLPTMAELDELGELANEWVPPEFPSGPLVAGPALVQDLLRAVPLRHLRIGNPSLATAVLTREFLETLPLKELTHLVITPFTRPHDDLGRVFRRELAKAPSASRHEPERAADRSQQDLVRSYLANLSLLPSLERLSIGAVGWNLPVGTLNLDPSDPLPPRSLHVQRFALPSSFILPVEVRSLAAALAIGLTSFELDALGVGTDLDDLLMRLPPTLKRLVVRLGRSRCPCPYVTSYSGQIGAAALDLPNLVSLELKGDIVSPSTLAAISRLSHLERLTLGEHTQYDLAALLALLPRSDPDLDPSPPSTTIPSPPRPLRRLTLDICSCPPNEEDLVRSTPGTAPRWPSGFGTPAARELLREATKGGVVVAAGACEGRTGARGSACAARCRA
ncbi:hypothetical protein JCM8208_001388 [Rhodotorula glutinis]